MRLYFILKLHSLLKEKTPVYYIISSSHVAMIWPQVWYEMKITHTKLYYFVKQTKISFNFN